MSVCEKYFALPVLVGGGGGGGGDDSCSWQLSRHALISFSRLEPADFRRLACEREKEEILENSRGKKGREGGIRFGAEGACFASEPLAADAQMCAFPCGANTLLTHRRHGATKSHHHHLHHRRRRQLQAKRCNQMAICNRRIANYELRRESKRRPCQRWRKSSSSSLECLPYGLRQLQRASSYSAANLMIPPNWPPHSRNGRLLVAALVVLVVVVVVVVVVGLAVQLLRRPSFIRGHLILALRAAAAAAAASIANDTFKPARPRH